WEKGTHAIRPSDCRNCAISRRNARSGSNWEYSGTPNSRLRIWLPPTAFRHATRCMPTASAGTNPAVMGAESGRGPTEVEVHSGDIGKTSFERWITVSDRVDRSAPVDTFRRRGYRIARGSP